MSAADIIELANRHLGAGCMVSSARLCLDDARQLLAASCADARQRALRSLAYSVGILHPDYRRAIGA